MSTLDETIRTLHRERPRNHRLRVGGAAIAALVAYAWSSSDIQISDAFSGRRLVNAQRFLGDVVPFPLRDGAFSWQGLLDWTTRLLSDGGAEAVSATLAIAIAAAVFAAIAGALVAPFAAANIATPAPFAETLLRPSRLRFGLARIWLVNIRAFLIFLRAIPEYVWAFLWIAMFGFTAWPAVLALAIHNTGILGKLNAEVLENADATAAVALRRIGAGRAQILSEAYLPAVLPRFLLYFFYRWETCVREATVLGMLGVASLGALIRDARAANFYDEMMFYVLLGAVLVMAGDIASALARRAVRRAP